MLFLLKVCDESRKTLILYGEVTGNTFGPIGDPGLQFADGRELFYVDEPQCAAVCPVDNCCIADPLYPESTEVLLERARKLNPDKEIDPNKVWSGVRN